MSASSYTFGPGTSIWNRGPVGEVAASGVIFGHYIPSNQIQYFIIGDISLEFLKLIAMLASYCYFLLVVAQ